MNMRKCADYRQGTKKSGEGAPVEVGKILFIYWYRNAGHKCGKDCNGKNKLIHGKIKYFPYNFTDIKALHSVLLCDMNFPKMIVAEIGQNARGNRINTVDLLYCFFYNGIRYRL